MNSRHPSPLRILSAGGTFEKSYDPIKGSLGFSSSHLNQICTQARLQDDVNIEVVMLIDSLDMNEGHRAQIMRACLLAPESRVVIVHGTDTMVETAQALSRENMGKTIVLTGAMVPFQVAASDALFNLGFAMAAARLQPTGVYIAMNAQLFEWSAVRKNRSLGRFEAL